MGSLRTPLLLSPFGRCGKWARSGPDRQPRAQTCVSRAEGIRISPSSLLSFISFAWAGNVRCWAPAWEREPSEALCCQPKLPAGQTVQLEARVHHAVCLRAQHGSACHPSCCPWASQSHSSALHSDRAINPVMNVLRLGVGRSPICHAARA